MKYSKMVLQAEVTRFENGIELLTERIKKYKDNKETIKRCKGLIKEAETQIKELKVDIAKL